MRAEEPRQSARSSVTRSVQGARCHGKHRCRSVLRRSRLVRAFRTLVNPSGVVHAAWTKISSGSFQLSVEHRVELPLFRVGSSVALVRSWILLQIGPVPKDGWLARAVQLNT